MSRTAKRPGIALAAGVALVCLAALAPAGLDGRPVPFTSFTIWLAVFSLAIAVLRARGMAARAIAARLVWLLPVVALLALPAALVLPAGRRLAVLTGLAARAFSSASLGLALAEWLGPAGFVAALRALRAPARFVHISSAALASLTLVLRQVRAMLRARQARRPAGGPWAALATSPGRTARAYGRLVAALLLRSLERAEALDRARRARGTGDA
jgi:energy-coupling factor transporter transmembrane protein EcfT